MRIYANICACVKQEIADECGILVSAITNRTKFMGNPDFSYFNCVDVLYTLEHEYDIKLPEAGYRKYKTVGSLARYISHKVKHNTK